MAAASSYTVAQLAERVGGRWAGNGEAEIRHAAGLDSAGPHALVFIEDPALLPRAVDAGAGCCITPLLDGDPGITRIEVRRPKLAFAIAAALLHPRARHAGGVHPTAVVAASARVHPTAFVGPYAQVGEDTIVGAETYLLGAVVLGKGVRIGERCTLHPHVTVYDGVRIGDRVVLHAGAVIGAAGFGYVRGPDGYERFPQIGGVIIGDDVEVGANTCIDRGALGDTRIGRGTKIDNLVMIAHNVQIGERVVMAGQVGISGSTRVGDDVVLAGQVGLSDHVDVGNGAQIGAKSAVFTGKIIPAGGVVMGIPARPLPQYLQVSARANRLPQMHEQLAALRREVAEMQARLAALSGDGMSEESE